MGKAAKGSRKGKKAWRANISTAEIEDYYEKSVKDTLSGVAALPSLPDPQLFFVDKSSTSSSTKDIPVRKKIEKHRKKILHHESIFERNAFVQPVPSSTLRKRKGNKKRGIVEKKSHSGGNAFELLKKTGGLETEDLDIWKNEGEANGLHRKRSSKTLIPAVEVEPPGCSYNPPFEAHQDSLAKAVADEMQKIFKKELGPEPVPLIVTGEALTEEDKFFIDADDDEEDVMEENPGLDNDESAAVRKAKTKRVTRVELNRRARRKETLRMEEELKKIEKISDEIDRLPNIIKEIEDENEEKRRKHQRRVVANQERLKARPPRIGKHKFEPAPVQVLLSEEITGSLRELKGCCTLARDRFKSLEKRGLVVPSKHKRR